MRISDGSIGSQLDTAPSISFPLGFLKFIAHSTSLRSVAHRGLPFSDHCTSWVCTEMLIYHHMSSTGLCEPAWVRCTPWENLAFPARGRRCFTPLRVCVSLFGAPSALGPCAARAEFVTVLDRGWDEIQEGKLPRTLSAQRTGGFSTWTLTGQGDTLLGWVPSPPELPEPKDSEDPTFHLREWSWYFNSTKFFLASTAHKSVVQEHCG